MTKGRFRIVEAAFRFFSWHGDWMSTHRGLRIMVNEKRPTQCPFLGEMVVIYCQAYPVRKPVPKHPITVNNPCMGGGHRTCPFFKDTEPELESAAAHRQAADS